MQGVGRVIDELRELNFDYVLCDSPAGIEKGAQLAMYYADEAIVVTNPEVSSVRDSDSTRLPRRTTVPRKVSPG